MLMELWVAGCLMMCDGIARSISKFLLISSFNYWISHFAGSKNVYKMHHIPLLVTKMLRRSNCFIRAGTLSFLKHHLFIAH